MMNIKGMMGLGDSVYMRAFLTQIKHNVYLDTPWPELYCDLPHVKPVRPHTQLRTQRKNILRHQHWHHAPVGRAVAISYGSDGIKAGMMRAFRTEPGKMSLPTHWPSPVNGRYVVVRPATVRAEWRADSRNPDPAYIAEAARLAQRAGFVVVSVADLEDGHEWLVGEAPPCDIAFHGGELDVTELLGLVHGAAGLIGGIGWLLPAAMAYGKEALIICGGQGGYNHPSRIYAGWQHDANIKFCEPDHFCMCTQKEHKCAKMITGFHDMAKEWIDARISGM